jgi:cobalt-zinc-cadmium efflux system membrane fusion protein
MKNVIITGLLLSLAIIAGCSGNNAPSAAEQTKATGTTITVAPSMNASLPLTTVSRQTGRIKISLSGKVDFDPTSVTHIYSLVNGVYNHIYVLQGATVHKGQVLADVYSSDIANAVSDYQKSSAALRNMQKMLVREQELFASKLAAEQDVEQAESNATQAQADYDRSLHTLKLLGGNPQTTSPVYQIIAPISGVVIESFAQPGMQVRNDGSQAAFTVGTTSSLWITLDAYADELRSLAVGDTAIIRAAGLEDHPFTATIQNINAVVDPTTFTTKIRCTLPNTTGLLKPAMFVSATVCHIAGSGLYIPATAAFLDSDGKYYAFTKRGDRKYQKIEIQVEKAESSRIEITGGLSNGDTIVADKALFLNDELASDQK